MYYLKQQHKDYLPTWKSPDHYPPNSLNRQYQTFQDPSWSLAIHSTSSMGLNFIQATWICEAMFNVTSGPGDITTTGWLVEHCPGFKCGSHWFSLCQAQAQWFPHAWLDGGMTLQKESYRRINFRVSPGMRSIPAFQDAGHIMQGYPCHKPLHEGEFQARE